MDTDNIELNLHEQVILLKQFNTNLVNLSNLLKEQRDKVEVSGAVTVNTEKQVTIDNIDEFTDSVDNLSEVLQKAIQENAYNPDSIKISNIKEAKADIVKIENLNDLKKYFDNVAEAVKKNQPIVNITKQEVVFPTDPKKPISVRLSDGKEFYKALMTAVSGSSGIQSALTRNNGTTIAVTNSDGSSIGGSATYIVVVRTDGGDANISYIGKALPDTATSENTWQIARLDKNTNLDLLFAGSGSFNQIFDNRESLSYS